MRKPDRDNLIKHLKNALAIAQKPEPPKPATDPENFSKALKQIETLQSDIATRDSVWREILLQARQGNETAVKMLAKENGIAPHYVQLPEELPEIL